VLTAGIGEHITCTFTSTQGQSVPTTSTGPAVSGGYSAAPVFRRGKPWPAGTSGEECAGRGLTL